MWTINYPGSLTGLLLLTLIPAGLAAQKGGAPPANVVVQASGSGAAVAWDLVKGRGVTYRVLRALDAKAPGLDITRPVDGGPLLDQQVAPGTTYFYQVVAVYPDGTTGVSPSVGYTVPAPPPAPSPAPAITSISSPRATTGSLKGPPVALAPGSTTRSPLATPTAVTNVQVQGTIASAVVSWQPVSGALSYSVKRAAPAGFGGGAGYGTPGNSPASGLPATTWTDNGSGGVGFPAPGVYTYQVTAALPGGASVTGQTTWRRPDPTCAAPPAGQPMLAVLDVQALPPAHFHAIGPSPNGGVFTWTNPAGAAAYRIERSTQGSAVWSLVGTSCGSAPEVMDPAAPNYGMWFFDRSGGVVPNTAYVYRLTTIAANGEIGVSLIPWNAPNTPIVRWLSAAVAGNTVTLKWRYEPPLTNPPNLPALYRVTAPYGLSQGSLASCAGITGCTVVVNGVPSGSHKISATSAWSMGSMGMNAAAAALPRNAVFARVSADTVITVP